MGIDFYEARDILVRREKRGWPLYLIMRPIASSWRSRHENTYFFGPSQLSRTSHLALRCSARDLVKS